MAECEQIVEDRGGIPGLDVIYRNGVTIRPPSSHYPDLPASAEFQDGVASKDYVLDPSRDLWARVFVPQSSEEEKQSASFPVVVYFHGGGFITLSPSTFLYHHLCHQISKNLSAIVVSVSYRLAPENRLPAAYEDGFTALKWIATHCSREMKEEWFQGADFSKVFVAGDSAGGNIAHCMTIRAAQQPESLSFKLAGQILIQPFFGGVARSESEVKFADSGPIITTGGCDFFWRMALPEGAGRDHEYCDVLAGLEEAVKSVPDECFPRTFVAVGELDLLFDRGIEYGKILEDGGKSVELVRFKAEHAFYFVPDSTDVTVLLEQIVAFCKQ